MLTFSMFCRRFTRDVYSSHEVIAMDRHELRAWRKARKLSQAQLGEMLGVTRDSVWRWEQGAFAMPLPMLELALEALDHRLREQAKAERIQRRRPRPTGHAEASE
jgi:transcriptional regulator with XRE-family HTH domain